MNWHFILSSLAIGTALLAAFFWFKSAIIKIPDLADTPMSGKGSITDLMQKQSKLSAIGAIFAALSALLQAVDTYLH